MSHSLKWKLALGFALVFFAGAVTGGWFTASRARHVFHRPLNEVRLNRVMLDRLRRQLDLTPAQVQQIEPMVQTAVNDLEKIRRETAERVHARMKSAHEQVEPLLTLEQRTKLREIASEHERRMHHRRSEKGKSLSGSPAP